MLMSLGDEGQHLYVSMLFVVSCCCHLLPFSFVWGVWSVCFHCCPIHVLFVTFRLALYIAFSFLFLGCAAALNELMVSIGSCISGWTLAACLIIVLRFLGFAATQGAVVSSIRWDFVMAVIKIIPTYSVVISLRSNPVTLNPNCFNPKTSTFNFLCDVRSLREKPSPKLLVRRASHPRKT